MKGRIRPSTPLFHPLHSLSTLILLFFFIQACTNEDPEFHRLNDEVDFRRVSLGDEGHEVAPNEAVRFFVRMRAPEQEKYAPWTQKDSVTAILPGADNNWSEILCSMAKGDSSIFRIEKNALFPYPDGMKPIHPPDSLERVRLEIRLVDHMPSLTLIETELKKRKGQVPKKLWREWKGIRREVIKRSDDPEKHFVNGIYLFIEEKGEGDKVEKGKEVAVHYRGYLPDRTVIDDSYERGEPFSFRYGDPEQVIEGMERGLGQLREGDRAGLIIPSTFAFEKKNSTEGILPPYTYVIYNVEIMAVEDP